MVKRRKPVRREHNIGIRVTATEKKLIKMAAKRAALSVTDWIVAKAIEESD